MKRLQTALICIVIVLASQHVCAQHREEDCEIYLDELELQFKKDQRDTRTYFHAQLEDGNAIFEKDLKAIQSREEKREFRKEYRTFVRGLEKDFNNDMDKLEDQFFDELEEVQESCGNRAVRRLVYRHQEAYQNYLRRRPHQRR